MSFDGVSGDAMEAYRTFDALTGEAPPINSAYRSPEHNERVGGARHSEHTHGNAFDFDVSGRSIPERVQLIQQARQSGFNGVGVYDNSLHFDVGNERAWGPSHSRDSLPDWYLQAFGPNAAPAAPQQAPQGGVNRLLTLAQAAPQWNGGIDPRSFGL
ncbi:MAG: YcbK family protein [Pikeienuella sp.]